MDGGGWMCAALINDVIATVTWSINEAEHSPINRTSDWVRSVKNWRNSDKSMTVERLTDNPLRLIIRLKPPTDECISHLTLVGFSWFTAMNQELQECVVHIAVSKWTSLIVAYLFTYSLICLFIVYLFI